MRSKESQGFATVGVTLLLLLMLAAVTLYAGKVLLIEKRISANEQQYATAFAHAEAGLDAAGQMFIADIAGTCDRTELLSLPVPAGSPAVDVTVEWVCTDGTSPVVISSTYSNSDGASATVSEAFARSALFSIGQPAPVTMATAAMINGNLHLGVNPNGGGRGVPLSLWTGGTDDFTGSASTCPVEDFGWAGGTCSSANHIYTERAGNSVSGGQDMVLNDPNFPEDLFEYTFGIASDNWQQIYHRGATKITDCSDTSQLSAASTGIFVYEGTAECVINNAGSADAPVILLVVDADAKLNTGDVYGVVFNFDSDVTDALSPRLFLTGDGKVQGAVMTNSLTPVNINGVAGVAWNPNVFDAFEEDPDGVFRPLARVAGSWKDF
ncbi:PilX N-terminal domain-containing pilus assembly protein [Ferrimonas gelatinilytica]|uniref:Type 4 fimbrial biogenesis protein PilX N-terminal domain-containing protein n=1 Tax=Ferrimonas gelatinilytica TaxID=1255257 RepID=A0ABP9SF40_9GAMM